MSTDTNTPAAIDYSAVIDGFLSDEVIKQRIENASIDMGGSALDLLEERLYRGQAKQIERYLAQQGA